MQSKFPQKIDKKDELSDIDSIKSLDVAKERILNAEQSPSDPDSIKFLNS